jgi:hypothetical protein
MRPTKERPSQFLQNQNSARAAVTITKVEKTGTDGRKNERRVQTFKTIKRTEGAKVGRTGRRINWESSVMKMVIVLV